MREHFLPLTVPWIGEREKALVLETLDGGWITTGPRAHELGNRIAALAGAKHGLAVNSATGALHLSLVALGVGRGDEVITSAYTFAACINVIEHVGATPVLVDVEADTLCLDPRAVERAITPRTRVIMPVDYAGHPCVSTAEPPPLRGLPLVEDAAHVLGAATNGRPIGSSRPSPRSVLRDEESDHRRGRRGGDRRRRLAERIGLRNHGMNRDA